MEARITWDGDRLRSSSRASLAAALRALRTPTKPDDGMLQDRQRGPLRAALQRQIHVAERLEPELELGARNAAHLVLELARLERRSAREARRLLRRVARTRRGFEAQEL